MVSFSKEVVMNSHNIAWRSEVELKYLVSYSKIHLVMIQHFEGLKCPPETWPTEHVVTVNARPETFAIPTISQLLSYLLDVTMSDGEYLYFAAQCSWFNGTAFDRVIIFVGWVGTRQWLFSVTETRNRCYRALFSGSGVRSTITDLKDGTVMQWWAPKVESEGKPNLVLIHGLGANALWQWGDFVRHVTPYFNVYVPDLVFFGGSHTTRPERGERFQAECLVRVMEAKGVGRVSIVGLSYGGFVGYCVAALPPEMVERVVLRGSGVCMEERDLKEGLFPLSDLDEAATILVPQTPSKLRDLVRYTFFKPPSSFHWLPSCFLLDFIQTMRRDYEQEKRELIKALVKDRKLSDLPKISQPTLIIWGEHDQVFPLELGHRLKRHLGDNAQLVVIKNAGHAFNMEKAKEFYCILKSYLVDLQLPAESSPFEVAK
ncbi:hypothetical protein VNO78_31027 [Psophocarpus tetragonolobus]|uniref:AB hydrolase-1 domain-containing protein n=1 Tax=Psophocarpus tetragonolobus TaxID=3891 RepID=A0AAN9RXX4_PSOTE